MLSWIIPYKTSGQDLTKKIVSINETNITVSNALDKIYKAYSIKFAFNAKELNKFKIENVSMKEKPLGEVLNQLLKGTGHLYKSIGNQIVIYKDSEAEKTESREVPKPKAKDNPKTIEKPAEPINIRPSNDTIFKHDTVFLTKTITLRDTITLKDTIIVYKDYDSKAALKKIRDRKYSVRMAYSQELTALSATPQQEELKDLSFRSFGVKIEGGHTRGNWDFSLGVGVNSLRHEINLTKKENPTQAISIDTTDIYYNIIGTDTVFHYVIDSTVVNMPGTIHEIKDINSLTYLNLDANAAYCFYTTQTARMYVKAAFGVGFLLDAGGYQMSVNDFKKVKTSFLVGLGVNFSLSRQCDLAPEIYFKNYNGNLYKSGDDKIEAKAFGIRVGLHYYF